MSYILGVDIGGTFTDAFAAGPDGSVVSAKAPSTPPDYATGFLDALDELARELELGSTEALLADTAYICHGTTSTLNALITGRVAEVGFITTRGHRDAIYIMNGQGRYAGLSEEAIQNLTKTRKPAALLPKARVKEVTERVDAHGAILVALDEEETRAAIRDLVAQGVQAIAVSLLWSFLAPAHERRIRELVAEEAPGLYVALSSDVSPRIREYARSTTTIMSTQVGPILTDYLRPLQAALEQRGLTGPLLVMQGSGGSVSAADAPRNAIQTVGSVLTGGVVGAVNLAKLLGHRNVISTDVGGTTFLVGLVADGEPVSDTETIINQYAISAPMVSVHTIGSGGGAIAWLDHGGNLRVGPDSAGAHPGPACYGAGGDRPTVTDANLVLGILNDEYFLGGRKPLDKERARRALAEHIGAPLGLDAEQAAAAVFAVQNAQTADLVRKVVVEAGHDPRDFALYSFGGGGPIHCYAYSAELGIKDIVVPLGPMAAAFSAYGLAASDLMATAELSDPSVFPADPDAVNANFMRLEQQVRDQLDAQGVAFERLELRREVDLRFTAQTSEVSTPVKLGELDGFDLGAVVDAFEHRYAQLFGPGTGFRGAGFQVITYRVQAIGVLPFKPQLPIVAAANGHPVASALKGRRPVFLDVTEGFRETAIYDYRLLRHGHVVPGPAIIEAPTTTVVIPADAEGHVDRLGNVQITFEEVIA